MKIRLLKGAKKDLEEAGDFYESQEPGIGSYFLSTMASEIDSLKIYAGIHPITFGRYYRLLTHKFPYAIYYRIVDDEVHVYAVFDCRRDPKRLENRFK